LILIVIGIAVVGGVIGWILAIVGLVPLVAGVFDWCFDDRHVFFLLPISSLDTFT